MMSYALTVPAVVASAALAATPSGFIPASQNDLFVDFDNVIIDGTEVI